MPPCADTWPLARFNGWDHSYGEMVEEWLFVNLPSLRLKARHAAIGGSLMTAIADRYDTCVKPAKPNWVIITSGSNDAARGVPLQSFADTLTRYIEVAQRDSGARFLYAGGFLPMPGVTEEGRQKLEKCQPYFDAARRAIQASGGLTPPMGPAMLRRAEELYALSPFNTFYADGVHLNGLGNRVLASLVLEALGAYKVLCPSPTVSD
jgi:lysophospholipase L1-like esterase